MQIAPRKRSRYMGSKPSPMNGHLPGALWVEAVHRRAPSAKNGTAPAKDGTAPAKA